MIRALDGFSTLALSKGDDVAGLKSRIVSYTRVYRERGEPLGDGPWAAWLWRDRRPAILLSLDRVLEFGDRFVKGGEI